jgi:hypothetical protein
MRTDFRDYINEWYRFYSGVLTNFSTDKKWRKAVFNSFRRKEFYRKEWWKNFRIEKRKSIIEGHWGYALYIFFSRIQFKVEKIKWHFYKKAVAHYERNRN